MSNTAIALLAIGLFLVGVVAIVLSMRRLRRGKLSAPFALGIAIVFIAAVSIVFAMFASSPGYDPAKDHDLAAREARLYAAGFNLLPLPTQQGYYYRSSADGSFVLSDTKSYTGPPVATSAGEQFHFTYMVTGTGTITSACTWENQAHIESGAGGIRQDVTGATNLGSNGQLVYGACSAPNDPAVAYLRVALKQAGGNATISHLRLADDNIRVEQWPGGRSAALAFSFDWESAMGGPIHSRGMSGHDVQFGVTQGMAMRQGVTTLLQIFAQNSISATFYATGYNLLDSSSKATFQNPIYSWASPQNGWATDYWLKHGWYSDDPFGNTTTDPAWYFGDQTTSLLAAGQEIATHTFGHLYVRGATPDQLDADLSRWQTAAAAKGITDVTTFAFPWRSSNSVDQPFYDVLRKHGIVAVTRLYEKDLRFAFQFGVAPKSNNMMVVPDFLLGSGSTEETASKLAGEGVGLNVQSLSQATTVIDDDILLGGVTSFWNHPLALVDGANQQLWSSVAAYAAQQRDAGKLWIAPVGAIVARYDAMRQMKIIPFPPGAPTNKRTLITDVNNPTTQPISDVTISVDGTISEALIGGKPATLVPALAQHGKLVIGTIAPGATIRVTVTVQQ